MPWSEGQHLPYDGWYGGRVDLMIANGTYADYREKIVRRVKRGFYSDKGTPEDKIKESAAKLAKWDAEWDAIPVEERIKRRDVVADDLEVKEKIIHTARGPARVFRSRPSNNNNLERKRSAKGDNRVRRNPAGFISKTANPQDVLITTKGVTQANTTNPNAPQSPPNS